MRGSAFRTAASVPFSRVTRCCRNVWAGPLFLHIPERAYKIGERLPVDARRRIGELFIPAPAGAGGRFLCRRLRVAGSPPMPRLSVSTPPMAAVAAGFFPSKQFAAP
ncbi:hypothetical protein [Bilophila sp.]|uniref:hypothetical protein n=1 Tax=Bilophila sp. TaxID=1929485 RepID=UPI0030776EE5